MEITIIEYPKVVVAVLKGRIDAFYAPELREKMEGYFIQGYNNFVLDLSDVEFLDSAGLAVLVSVLKHSQQKGGSTRLIMPKHETARRILHLTRFDKVFQIMDNSDIAVKSF
jgi:anti-sigma B factor antagonist